MDPYQTLRMAFVCPFRLGKGDLLFRSATSVHSTFLEDEEVCARGAAVSTVRSAQRPRCRRKRISSTLAMASRVGDGTISPL